jgi:hypothetical protein
LQQSHNLFLAVGWSADLMVGSYRNKCNLRDYNWTECRLGISGVTKPRRQQQRLRRQASPQQGTHPLQPLQQQLRQPRKQLIQLAISIMELDQELQLLLQ